MIQKKCPMHLPRIFLSLVFVFVGFGKITNFAGTVKMISAGTIFGTFSEPFATLLTMLAIIFEFGGGLMLLLNIRPRIAAKMLIVFTALAMIMFHLDWSEDKGQMQIVSFLKDLAILGGLLIVAHNPIRSASGDNDTKTETLEPAKA